MSSWQTQPPCFEAAAYRLAASSCPEVAAEELVDNRKLVAYEPSWAIPEPSWAVSEASGGADSTLSMQSDRGGEDCGGECRCDLSRSFRADGAATHDAICGD